MFSFLKRKFGRHDTDTKKQQNTEDVLSDSVIETDSISAADKGYLEPDIEVDSFDVDVDDVSLDAEVVSDDGSKEVASEPIDKVENTSEVTGEIEPICDKKPEKPEDYDTVTVETVDAVMASEDVETVDIELDLHEEKTQEDIKKEDIKKTEDVVILDDGVGTVDTDVKAAAVDDILIIAAEDVATVVHDNQPVDEFEIDEDLFTEKPVEVVDKDKAEAVVEAMDASQIKAVVQAMQQESGDEIFEFAEGEEDAPSKCVEIEQEESSFVIDVVDLYDNDEPIDPALKPDTETVPAKEIEAEMLAIEQAVSSELLPLNENMVEVESVPLQEKSNTETAEELVDADDTEILVVEKQLSKLDSEKTLGWAARIKQGLTKSRNHMAKSLAAVFGGGKIDEDLYEELETVLLTSDMGIEATEKLMDEVRRRVSLKGLQDGGELRQTLKEAVYDLLVPLEQPLEIPDNSQPFVIMMAGINGAGKTTSIGKLAKYFQAQGKSVVLAAGDTFRAAAREQLQEWGKRNDVTVISQASGDSAAVCFDAVEAAKARKIDIVLADTAGRLPTQLHLMEEIKKVKRVLQKSIPDAPHEIMVVLDANIGQNAVTQVAAFDDALGVTGLIVTKLDGTAKGGVLAALAERGIPVRYIGVGETIDDLRPFDTRAFVDALFDEVND